MRTTIWVLGALGACLLAGYTWRPSTAFSELALPDLDGDGVHETLHWQPAPRGGTAVSLAASAGHFMHPVLVLPGEGRLRIAGASPRWTLVDEASRERAEVLVLPGADLVVRGGQLGRRFHYLDRGFLKLDATAMIPGFSVGLLMVGDDAATMRALGGTQLPDGRWRVADVPGLDLDVTTDRDGRALAIAYTSPLMRATNGVRVGASAGDLAQHFPGTRAGARWLSPRYGLVADLDAAGRPRTMTVRRPGT